MFAPISRDGDWLAQDYPDSLGLSAVRSEGGGLAATARLRGGDPHLSKGEVYTDLKYFVGVAHGALDLRGRTVRVVVDVPDAFVGDPSAPNGVQVLVKDSDFRSQYSAYLNITAGGSHVVSLSPSSSSSDAAFTTPGFDPSRTRVIGVKFAIGGPLGTFSGTVRVHDATVTPALSLPPAPLAGIPVPRPVFPRHGGVTLRSDGFYVAGARRFLTGGNYTPIEYGAFGSLAWYPEGNGVSRHPNYIAASLAAFRKAAVHVIRVPLAADGRALLDPRGVVIGYNERWRADVRTLLQLARANDQRVEFTLADFLIAGPGKMVNGVALQGRPEIFTDPATRAAFFARFVGPLLRDFGSDGALFGVDCVNEPEWLISKREGGHWEDVDPATRAPSPIPLAALNAYLNDCVAAVKASSPRLPVTAGTSVMSLALTSRAGDYTAAHHYPYMGALGSYTNDLPTSRPWILEEFPTSDQEYAKSRTGGGPGDLPAYLSAARSLGAAGAWLWSLNPDTDSATVPAAQFESRLLNLRAWCNHNAGTLCNHR